MFDFFYWPLLAEDFGLLPVVIMRGQPAEATPRFDREIERIAGYPCDADSDGGECD